MDEWTINEGGRCVIKLFLDKTKTIRFINEDKNGTEKKDQQHTHTQLKSLSISRSFKKKGKIFGFSF